MSCCLKRGRFSRHPKDCSKTPSSTAEFSPEKSPFCVFLGRHPGRHRFDVAEDPEVADIPADIAADIAADITSTSLRLQPEVVKVAEVAEDAFIKSP